MKKILFSIIGMLLAVIVIPGSAFALLVGGPSPIPGFGSDDGTELFVPLNPVLNLEIYDIGGALAGSTFGFYFQGTDVTNAANRITIFGPDDETTAGNPQLASINFGAGLVFDFDDFSLQSVFTNLPGSNIGFFFSTFGGQIYTEAALNGGGMDLSATFQSQTDPTVYLIGFESPTGATVALEVTAGIQPVPEPSSMLLLGSGMLGLALLRRKVRR